MFVSIRLLDFIAWPVEPLMPERPPWTICADAAALVRAAISELPASYRVLRDGIAVHETATIEDGAILKPPCIIGAGCFVAAYAYLRDGVWLGEGVVIGPSVEIKSSFIGPNSSAAHFNFVGNSILGAGVNLEAGAILANYRNEAADKEIVCVIDGVAVRTGCEKFGALVGDGCRIGANAVLAPGTILSRGTIVPRLKLIDQVAELAAQALAAAEAARPPAGAARLIGCRAAGSGAALASASRRQAPASACCGAGAGVSAAGMPNDTFSRTVERRRFVSAASAAASRLLLRHAGQRVRAAAPRPAPRRALEISMWRVAG